MEIPYDQIPPKLLEHFQAPEDRTRDRIIATARRKFLPQGFARVTIEELCFELRMSKKTFYAVFRDKEDLIYGVMADLMKTIHTRILRISESKDPPDKRFEDFVDMIFNTIFPNISVPFLADIQAMLPELWEAVAAQRRMNFQVIVGIVKEGQKLGLVRQDISVSDFAKVLTLILDRVADPGVLYERGLQITQVTDILIKLFLAGLKPEHETGGVQ